MLGFRWGRLQPLVYKELFSAENNSSTHWLLSTCFLDAFARYAGQRWRPEQINASPHRSHFTISFFDSAQQQEVLICAQLDDSSEHVLGWLLRQAQGKPRSTLVLLKSSLTAEDVAQVAWLNQITVTNIRFCAVELNFWQVANSDYVLPIASGLANRDQLVRKWQTIVPLADETPVLEQNVIKPITMYREFWLAFNCELLRRKSPLSGQKPANRNWASLPLDGQHRLVVALNPDTKSCAVGLLVSGDEQGDIYKKLEPLKSVIERDLGVAVQCQFDQARGMTRIYVRRAGCQISHREAWPELIDWVIDTLEKFQTAFEVEINARLIQTELDMARDVAAG